MQAVSRLRFWRSGSASVSRRCWSPFSEAFELGGFRPVFSWIRPSLSVLFSRSRSSWRSPSAPTRVLALEGDASERAAIVHPAVALAFECRELRDELFAQLVKQTNATPETAVALRLWELFALVTSILLPASQRFMDLVSPVVHARANRIGTVAARKAAAAEALGVTVLWGVCRTMRDYFRSPAFDTTRRKTLRVARAAAQATLRGEQWTDEMIENAQTWRGGFVRCVRRRRPNTTPAATPRAPAAAFASAPRRRFRCARALSPRLSRARRADRTRAHRTNRVCTKRRRPARCGARDHDRRDAPRAIRSHANWCLDRAGERRARTRDSGSTTH